jgi:hypothetical protein
LSPSAAFHLALLRYEIDEKNEIFLLYFVFFVYFVHVDWRWILLQISTLRPPVDCEFALARPRLANISNAPLIRVAAWLRPSNAEMSVLLIPFGLPRKAARIESATGSPKASPNNHSADSDA